MGVVSIPAGALLFWLTFYEIGPIARWSGRLFGPLLFLGGALMLVKSVTSIPVTKRNPYRLVMDHPERLTWFYTLASMERLELTEAKRETTLYLCSQKKRYPLLVPVKKLTILLGWLRERSPQAMEGATSYNRKRYFKRQK